MYDVGHRIVKEFSVRAEGKEQGLPYTEERFWTAATVVTVLRTLASLACALIAAWQQEIGWLVAALGIYWVGDIADGFVARRLRCETRLGATLDIVSDRLNCAGFYLGLVWIEPIMAIPAGIYLFEFMVIDAVLSLAFLAWPVRSPNYFYLVDERIYRWNWSPVAKVANSGLLALGLLLTGWWHVGAVWALLLLAGKAVSLRRLLQIGIPTPTPAATGEPGKSSTHVG